MAAAGAPSGDDIVRVGVGVLLVKTTDDGGKLVLVGKRKGSHGAGKWALPGGHLEYGESFEACATREVLEETGIALPEGAVRFTYATNTLIDITRHYITIFMQADVPQDAEAALLEPHKCEGWIWAPYDQVPQPHFEPLAALLASGFKLQ